MHILTHGELRENMDSKKVETESRLQRESLAPGLLFLGYLFHPGHLLLRSGGVEEKVKKGGFCDKEVLYLL